VDWFKGRGEIVAGIAEQLYPTIFINDGVIRAKGVWKSPKHRNTALSFGLVFGV
jgi:hypothetical protein